MRIRKMNALLFVALCIASSCSKKGNSPTPPVTPPADTTTTHKQSGPGDVVGKVVVGYQGWFAAIGDGSPINMYWHWSQNWQQEPSPTNTAMDAWPDVRDY